MDHEEKPLNEIVLPLLNVSRRLPDNTVNENEVNQQTIAMTSAGVKTSFAYDKLIDMFEKSIINPKSAFVFGCDYRVPVLHGLLDKDFISDLKMSPSFNEDSFAREYASIWSGSSEESWFNFEKISKYRKLKNPEKHKIDRPGSIQFYLLSVDVGRLSDQTVVCVHRVNVVNGKYHSSLVNIFVLGKTASTKPFSIQARDLKEIIELFQPKEVVVDTNGLGNGLRDELLRPNVDVQTGETYLPWDAINGEIRSEYREAIPILYALNSQNKDETKKDGRINNYAIINFIDCVESQKLRLLEERKDNTFDPGDIDQVEAFVPFAQTNALVEEITNLKLKHLTNGEVTVEKVLGKIDKDRFSSLMYALWWAMSYDNILQTDNRDLVMTIAKMNGLGSRRSNSLNKLFR